MLFYFYDGYGAETIVCKRNKVKDDQTHDDEEMEIEMMKKISKILGMLLLLIMLVACKEENTLGDNGANGSEAKQVLRVGMECAYAPFNWTQTSKEVKNGAEAEPIYGSKDYAYGYDVIVAQKLADEMGMELEIHKVDWSSIILGMNAGDYDVILAGMGYTEERDKSVDFTDAYYLRDNVVIVRKDSAYSGAKSLAELKGASATTQIGTMWEQFVPQIPEVNQMTYFETTAEVVMAVSTGSADCGVFDEPTAISATISNPDLTYLKFDEENGFALPEGISLKVCIAVKEGNKELLDQLDAALDAIEWDEAKMKEIMDLAVTLQPLSE